ncbi:sporulation protein YabP [Ructibacterium gallinarum]|uniref:Sporulation protein YabP n=1 Tax=Ructibacterium gallinarum TaxID=2779355 RepID=A0A9D5M085_9FIRM|nr:sporulation protein YabP [Ructibacterium gallinarum]MBE5040252.1 sporulation protein YabP [Ructibacterium gallinarum]
MEEEKRHFITMENREKLTITEVEDVESFDEEKVVVYTSMGTMTVIGSEFRIHKLNVEDGQLVIEGEIDEIKYSQTRETSNQGGFFSRLFQ